MYLIKVLPRDDAIREKYIEARKHYDDCVRSNGAYKEFFNFPTAETSFEPTIEIVSYLIEKEMDKVFEGCGVTASDKKIASYATGNLEVLKKITELDRLLRTIEGEGMRAEHLFSTSASDLKRDSTVYKHDGDIEGYAKRYVIKISKINDENRVYIFNKVTHCHHLQKSRAEKF